MRSSGTIVSSAARSKLFASVARPASLATCACILSVSAVTRTSSGLIVPSRTLFNVMSSNDFDVDVFTSSGRFVPSG
ncbi:propanediol dehydratase [Listeria monocytogenes]|nr:propanediol dehydratase [Listeria monocytogenes]